MDEKIVTWLERLLREHIPGPDRPAARAKDLFAARRALLGGGGEVFGYRASPELCTEILASHGPRIEALIADWKSYLETEHGADGAQAFANLVRASRLPAIFPRDPAMTAAVARLLQCLEGPRRAIEGTSPLASFARQLFGDGLVAYRVEPPVPMLADDFPPDVCALFAELSVLEIATDVSPEASGRRTARVADESLFDVEMAGETSVLQYLFEDLEMLEEDATMLTLGTAAPNIAQLVVRAPDGAIFVDRGKLYPDAERGVELAPNLLSFVDSLADLCTP